MNWKNYGTVVNMILLSRQKCDLTAADKYCTTYDVNLKLSMPEFSILNTIPQQFYIDSNEVKLGIGYKIIICQYLMVHIALIEDLKRNIL